MYSIFAGEYGRSITFDQFSTANLLPLHHMQYVKYVTTIGSVF
jgi:hypothetical protein